MPPRRRSCSTTGARFGFIVGVIVPARSPDGRLGVKAEVRAAVRRTLRRRGVQPQDLEPFIERFLGQAEALYANWPLAA